VGELHSRGDETSTQRELHRSWAGAGKTADRRGALAAALKKRLPDGGVTVRVLLHDGQLIRGMFVSFDPVWNPILRDCVEVHPQAGHLKGK
jgi:small nuclear ribonucleoprotein (snRNP)-like protein